MTSLWTMETQEICNFPKFRSSKTKDWIPFPLRPFTFPLVLGLQRQQHAVVFVPVAVVLCVHVLHQLPPRLPLGRGGCGSGDRSESIDVTMETESGSSGDTYGRSQTALWPQEGLWQRQNICSRGSPEPPSPRDPTSSARTAAAEPAGGPI